MAEALSQASTNFQISDHIIKSTVAQVTQPHTEEDDGDFQQEEVTVRDSVSDILKTLQSIAS